MKFGLQVIHAWSENPGAVENVSQFLVDLAVEAEQAGWDGYFLWDHVYFDWQVIPLADPLTVLAAVAYETSEMRLGTTVTPLPRRRPQIVARQLASLDQISDGRAVLGAGLGGPGLGSEAGADFGPFGEETRYRLLGEMCDEALDVITGLWSGEQVTHRGKHYTIDGVTFLPVPVQKPRIPIWIGGTKSKALRRAAKYDGWVTGGPSPSAGDPGFTIDEVGDSVRRIMGHRETDAPFDVAYAFEFLEDGKEMGAFTSRAEEVGVTWMLDGIFGLRFNGKRAMEHVRKGPPQTQ